MAHRERLRIVATLAALILAGCASAVAHTSSGATTSPSPSPASTPPVPATSPTGVPTPAPSPPQASTVPLRVTQQFNLGTQMANTMSVSSRDVWVAVQGASYRDSGRLLRIDARSARQTASWVVGGDPNAVAAAGAYVWVANSYGDASSILPKQNTVEQFNATTGALVHIYRVFDPRGLVATANSALVISATTQSQTALSLLTGGDMMAFASVPGGLLGPQVSPQSAVAVCANQVFMAVSSALASGTSVTIYAVRPTGGALRTIATIPNYYEPEMTCDGVSLFVNAVVGAGEGR